MSLLRRLVGAPEVRNDVPWSGYPPFPLNSQQPGTMTFSGVNVSAETSMRHAAVWSCVRLITGAIGQMPVEGVRYHGGISEAVSPAPALLSDPSALVPRSSWMESVLTSLLLRGNAYGQVVDWDQRGYATRIEILAPDKVHPEWDQTSRCKVFYVNVNGARERHEAWGQGGDIWHVPGLMLPGHWVGMSPIEYAKQTIGQGLAAEKFGAQWFGEGGVPAAILSTEQAVTEEQASTIKSRFMNAVKGRREPAILGAGLKYEAIQVAPQESQFIEAQSWSTAQVARVFGISPSMLEVSTGSSNELTYQNREARVADFLAFSLGPWIHRLEESLTRLLPEGQIARFKTGAILRADLQTRYQSYLTAAQIQQATGTPLLTTDEMRALENLPPLDTANVADTTARINAVGVLVRAGYDPHDALKLLGLPDLGYAEVHPVTVVPADANGGPTKGTGQE
jgi:HK97 family phage portal protein